MTVNDKKPSNDTIKINAIEVLEIQPEASDLRKIKHYNETSGQRQPGKTMLVKIMMPTELFFGSLGYDLIIGEHHIKKYMVFKKGIFFKINKPGLLDEITGQKICFRIDGTDELIDTGTVLSISAADKLLLDSPAAAGGHLPSSLPTLQEALGL